METTVTLEIVPLQETHLDDAAELFTVRYRRQRAQVPPLPPRYEEASVIRPMLRDIAGRGPGVVAIRGGRHLVGHVTVDGPLNIDDLLGGLDTAEIGFVEQGFYLGKRVTQRATGLRGDRGFGCPFFRFA